VANSVARLLQAARDCDLSVCFPSFCVHSNAFTMAISSLEEMIADIDHGLRLEEQGFVALIGGTRVGAEEITRRAYSGWYLTGEDALSWGLVAGLV
jgi:hypothetical protein